MSALGCEHASPRTWCAECEVKELRAQLARAEKQLAATGLAHKELVGLSLRYDRLEAQLAEVQAQAAVMKSALEPILHIPLGQMQAHHLEQITQRIRDALAPDAGRALLVWTKLAAEVMGRVADSCEDCDRHEECGCRASIDLIRRALETAP